MLLEHPDSVRLCASDAIDFGEFSAAVQVSTLAKLEVGMTYISATAV